MMAGKKGERTMSEHNFIIISKSSYRMLRMCTKCGITHTIDTEAIPSRLKWDLVQQDDSDGLTVTVLSACGWDTDVTHPESPDAQD
jgi:hypothetical protein